MFQETTQSAIEACEAAREFSGGVFASLIPDNTEAIVQDLNDLHPWVNPTFLEYAQARGFTIYATRVRHPGRRRGGSGACRPSVTTASPKTGCR